MTSGRAEIVAISSLNGQVPEGVKAFCGRSAFERLLGRGGVVGGAAKDRQTYRLVASKRVSPAKTRRYEIIVVGAGLAGGSGAAVLGRQG